MIRNYAIVSTRGCVADPTESSQLEEGIAGIASDFYREPAHHHSGLRRSRRQAETVRIAGHG
jgi:hypothetical protein